LADEIEVAGFALNNATQTNHPIEVGIFGHELCPKGQLKSSRNMLNQYVVLLDAITNECLVCTLKQRLGNLLIPVGYHNSEFHFFCRRNFSGIVGG